MNKIVKVVFHIAVKYPYFYIIFKCFVCLFRVALYKVFLYYIKHLTSANRAKPRPNFRL
jgi:hypothetical protein